jgi:hypothetical protein
VPRGERGHVPFERRGQRRRPTIDRNLTTRWSPSGPGPQWITYDLGRMQEVSSVTVVWYASKPVSVPFTVGVSKDGVTYERQGSGSLAGRATVSALCTFLPADGRYVRLSVSPAEGSKCPGLYEVGIHGNLTMDRAMAK